MNPLAPAQARLVEWLRKGERVKGAAFRTLADEWRRRYGVKEE